MKTLPKRELVCGYGEILKHALISDKNFFSFLNKNGSKILDLKNPYIQKAIAKSCKIKKKIIELDETENNLRKILNFGHTFAHAYEATLNYSKKLNHGEAVILGILSASKFSFKNDLLSKKEFDLIKNHLYKLNLPNRVNSFFSINKINKIVYFMLRDKKNNSSKISLVLLRGIGNPCFNLNFSNININSPNVFDFLEISEKKLYIWGWAPQWYVLSYFFPSDRSTISQKYIEDFSNKLYFNKRLNADLKSNPPNLIIDFVKPGSFYYTHQKLGIKTSSIKKVINNSFVKINKNEECPDIYIKKESYNKLNKKIIQFKIKNHLIKNKLDDYSITEDICNDSVLFDDKSPNKLILNLENDSKLKKILILASRKNQSTVYMGVELEKKNSQTKILKKNIQLNKYPFWTEIKLKTNNSFIENILIDVSELKSLNYGINEIKLYR